MKWLLLIYCLWITPLRAGASLTLGPGMPRAAWGILAWGVGVRGGLRLRRDPRGRLRLETHRARRLWHVLHAPRRRGSRDGMKRLAGRARRIKETLSRGVRLRCLEITVQAGGDAARAALITGALRALNAVWPRADIRCRPAFGAETAVRVRCIVETRLGTLWTAVLLGWFIHRRQGRKEEQPWSIPSGT